MPLRLSLVVYPLFAFAVAMSQKGVASKFAEAGAISPETARKPSSLFVRDMDAVRSAARKGVLVSTGDGRFYVNQPVYRRRQRWMWGLLIGGGVVIAALTVVAYMPGHW